jgi:hypothetical protein
MDTWGPATWAVMIPIVSIIGAFTYIIVLTVMKARVRELEMRQRIALVERGLVPPPEADPRGFERAMNVLEVVNARTDDCCRRANRHRRAGITLMGVGLGLMLLIGVAGQEPQSGVGVGGFLVIVGLAFLANSWFEIRQQPSSPPPPIPPSATVTSADRPQHE